MAEEIDVERLVSRGADFSKCLIELICVQHGGWQGTETSRFADRDSERGSLRAGHGRLNQRQFDFEQVLQDKNAVVSLRQIIRELEESLSPMRSPLVMNGKGFGLFPNHSLVMASYLSRANSAVINLRELLDQG